MSSPTLSPMIGEMWEGSRWMSLSWEEEYDSDDFYSSELEDGFEEMEGESPALAP